MPLTLCRTILCHRTVGTSRFSGIANPSAMKNQRMAQCRPVGLRNQLHQFLLNLFRRFALGQAKPTGHSENMRVNNDAFVLAEYIAQYDVGRLAANAGQGDELLHRVGNIAIEPLDDFPTGILNVFCLIAEKSRRSDRVFQTFEGNVCIIVQRGELLEQFRRNLIDADVGTLGGENGCDH